MSGRSPWWRLWLSRHVRWLFIICPGQNYHWRWDRVCHCTGRPTAIAPTSAASDDLKDDASREEAT